MASRRSNGVRSNHNWLIVALVSGILYGLMAYFLKISLEGFGLSAAGMLIFLSNPYTWLTGLIALSGFLLMQKALYEGHVTLVTPIIGGVSIIIPVVLAFLFLGEVISQIKWIGLILILIGTAGLGK